MAVREPKRGRDRQAGREPDADGAAGHIFTDHARKRAPLIHLATMQEIERRPGRPVDPLRFERRRAGSGRRELDGLHGRWPPNLIACA